MTLTPEQKAILNAEIENDPKGKGYAAFLPDQPGYAINLLNAPTETKLDTVSRTDLTIWSVETDMLKVIEDESQDKTSPLRSSALAILHVLLGSSSGIDLSNPKNMAVLNAWEQLGKLTTEHKNMLISYGAKLASRCDVLKLPYMTGDLFANRNEE